jgi:hypothetical protein
LIDLTDGALEFLSEALDKSIRDVWGTNLPPFLGLKEWQKENLRQNVRDMVEAIACYQASLLPVED